jgi:hypothetical protein
MTLYDLLRSSFRCIGVLHEGQGPNIDDIRDSMLVLNSMLEAWSIERLNVFTVQPATYSLVGGQQTYGIGEGATDFNGPRPVRLERANLKLVGASGPYELPLEILSVDQWADITIKSTLSTIPERVYLDNQYPVANLHFWPVPSVTADVILYTWQAIQSGYNDVSVEVAFPPGYSDAIRYNLALRLAPEWGVSLRADVADLAREAKAAIKRINKPTMYLGCDDALLPQAEVWNWLTGTSSSHHG